MGPFLHETGSAVPRREAEYDKVGAGRLDKCGSRVCVLGSVVSVNRAALMKPALSHACACTSTCVGFSS